MNKGASIYVAGIGNMIGDRFLDVLREKGYSNLANDKDPEPDLRDLSSLSDYFRVWCPEYVFVTAGKSGGIQANQDFPAEIMLDNLQVTCNVIQMSHKHRVKKLLYIASSCSYPKYAKQPLQPEMLMTGSLEPTNAAYATAKLAGIELIRAYRNQYHVNYICAIPANVFGPGDKFGKGTAHVIAALLEKIHLAWKNGSQKVEIWGSGTPKREFIFLDDFINACVFLMERYENVAPVNVGTGQVRSIAELGAEIKEIIGYEGELAYDTTKPDGMPEKMLDSSVISGMGWSPEYQFNEAIRLTYEWYKQALAT